MLLALAVILLQAPAVPAPAIPAPYTNSANVSVAAATERKDDAKPATKADTQDGEKKSSEGKESSAPLTVASPVFPAGANVSYQPGQTVVTPIDNAVPDAPGTLSSS